jgi:CHAT domain-containing protein/tetratricopeptide (TPR) repeat protein
MGSLTGNVAGPRLLAHMLLERYDRTGAIQDVEAATRLIQTAVNQTPMGSPNLPGHLNALGHARYTRYEHQGDFADLEAAVGLYQRSLDLTPLDSTDRATRLLDLADALESLDDGEEGLELLERAIQLLRDILDTSPLEPVYLLRLGNALLRRFRRTKESWDIDEAVSVLDKCVNGTLMASPNLANRLDSFGKAELLKYRSTKDISDLEKSIAALERAVNIVPRASPSRPMYLNHLASALGDRYREARHSDDCKRATDSYRTACELGLALNPNATVNGAHSWGNWAAERAIANETTFDEAAEAFGCGLDAVRQLFSRQLFLEGKHVWLRENRLLPGRAAFALAASGRIEEAVVALERCRGLLLSESLRHGRANLEHLASLGRESLITHFRQSCERLNRLNLQQLREERVNSPEFADELLSAHADFDKAISEIRQVPGHESFLQPPTYEDIRIAADSVPIIYLTTSPWGGLALVVWPSRIGRSSSPFWQGTTPVWLMKLDEQAAFRMLFIGALSDDVPDRGPFGYFLQQAVWQQLHASAKAQHEFSLILDRVTRWLWDAALGPLLDVMLATGERRVVLITEGLLSLLPFHAAWSEGRNSINGRQYAMDELTISYAPSALALSEARQIALATSSESFLGIANPFPSSTHDALPHARDEVEMAASQFQSRLVLPPEEATFDRVRAELSRYSVLHFACHGEAEIGEPLNNGVLLADDRKLALRDFFGMDLHARLAVLSACGTGVVDIKLANEVIGLPTGLLQAGVAGIVSPQWAVDEIGAMLLMGRFYELWHTRRCEPSDALRLAQLWLRDATNKELLSYAKKLLPSVDVRSGEWEHIAAYSSERAFSEPRHWAAFTYVGV